MNRTAFKRPHTLVRWEFERQRHHLSCTVSSAPDRSGYEVATVPLWTNGRATIERFENPLNALHRHAAIALDLRETGWTLTAYSDGR